MSPVRPPARGLIAVTVVLLPALAAAPASATPITRSAPGHTVSGASAPGHAIRSVTTTVDPDTGLWRTVVTFDAPQSDETANALSVSLTPQGSASTGSGWAVDTDPARIGVAPVAPGPPAPTYDGAAPPPGALGYDADRTALTLQVTDPKLVGVRPDVVRVSAADPDGGPASSTASVFLGPTAPKPSLARAGRHLVTSRTGLITVPIRPLASRAAQRVAVSLPGTFGIGLKSLPAKYWRRTSVTFRVRTKSVRRTARKATLSRTTWLPNGSKASASRAVTIRRR
jgi:hypothetical protein